ncbi:MAG: transglutaminase-like domain-containing protein [Brevinematales bacterium]|nr:transglutaminase-like domain-containing protein [Brevinematales bacterium]
MKKVLVLLLFPFLFWGKSAFWNEAFHPLEATFWEKRGELDPIEGFLTVAWLTNRESVAWYASQWKGVIAEIQRQRFTNDTERAERILLVLHERFLKRYRETANTVSGVFQTGEFNCVSSSLLYALSARALGFPVRLNIYTTHARPEIFVGGQWVEVEATIPVGYNFRQKAQAQQDFIRLTSFADERTPRSVATNLLQWYAVWYANEVYMQVRRREISNAFQLAVRAIELESTLPFVRTNGIAAYQEYSSFLRLRGFTNEAISVLEEGIRLFPESGVLSNNMQVFVYQMVMDLLKAGRFMDATTMVNTYQPLLLEREDIIGAIYQELLYRLIQTNAYKQAWSNLQNIKKDFGNRNWYTKVSLYGMDSLVKKLISEWKMYPKDEDLLLQWYQDLTGIERDMYLADYYNRIALSYKDAGLWQKAVEVLQRGISFLPTATVLRKNLAVLYVMRGNDAPSQKEKITWYKQALEYDKENWEIERAILVTYRNLIEEYVNKEDWRSVLQYAEEGLLSYPNDKQLQYYRDYARRKLGK